MDISKYINDNQDEKDIEKILDKLNGILMNAEELIYIAVQKKPAINISPDYVAITDKRIIFCRPKNLGLSMEFQDFIWRDLKDCNLKENMLGATITVKTIHNLTSEIDYLPKTQARKIYSYCQEQEEIQNEIRRQREIEVIKASAGRISLDTPQSQQPTEEKPVQEDPVETLSKLKKLMDNFLITRDEYEAKKQEVLSRM
ncbi:PH domain-containing protein [Moheibacter sediminis]|uniref:PH domain-containing protein n=1 Tax=Moheibacter sediminis TaxID=1434700 RepID=A0A1W1ZDJ1_9FLAO|nr:PH domain-containing protein [Moheibacter sediminis]SMC46221.1 PH domain-containing protein [Moheibacter sediminis]